MPVAPSPGGVRVERVVTSGVFELDGGSWEVDNNVWLVGDDTEVLVVDGGSTVMMSLEATGVSELIPVFKNAADAERAAVA